MSYTLNWPPPGYPSPIYTLQLTLGPTVIELLREIIAGRTSAPNDDIALLRAEITKLRQDIKMSGSALDQAIQTLTTEVASNTDASGSAVAAINGIPAMIKTAVDTALAAGATPAQLQAITDLGNIIATNAVSLGSAVIANTTAATTQPPAPAPTPAPAPPATP